MQQHIRLATSLCPCSLGLWWNNREKTWNSCVAGGGHPHKLTRWWVSERDVFTVTLITPLCLGHISRQIHAFLRACLGFRLNALEFELHVWRPLSTIYLCYRAFELFFVMLLCTKGWFCVFEFRVGPLGVPPRGMFSIVFSADLAKNSFSLVEAVDAALLIVKRPMEFHIWRDIWTLIFIQNKLPVQLQFLLNSV